MGGIIVPAVIADSFDKRLLASRLPELPKGEMKWAKVSNAKLAAYKRLIDAFFDRAFSGCHFHSLVVESAKQNHSAFNQGSREIGFNKELFQLARKFARLYPNRFHVYPDQRTTTQKLDDLRVMLNRSVHKKEPHRDWPYRRVQFRDSAATLGLQLADIMSGAIAYRLNKHHQASGASPAKCELATYILGKANVNDVHRDTSMSGKFTIWQRKLR